MLRYDNLGIGDSDGDWGDGSLTIKVQDTVRAATLLAERGTSADLLVGHSWGGAAAIAAAAEATGVRAVTTIGAPVDPSHVERQYDTVMDRVLSEGSHEWFVGGRTLVLKRAFVDDVHRARLRERIRELHTPLSWESSHSHAALRASTGPSAGADGNGGHVHPARRRRAGGRAAVPVSAARPVLCTNAAQDGGAVRRAT